MRRRGELSKTAIDRGWPYQVAVISIPGQDIGHLHLSGPFSSLCSRRHRVGDGTSSYEVLCFADRAQADAFRETIKGETFDPRDRVGQRWMRGRGAKRDAKRRY